ncbi:MAG: indole-3-glycerol phosphate synthase TrpC [Deltaproteobacteria bacterium]|nr:indole-3-glycerol phosphate synthase TrpC [Deltaproteobacteria bacterium]
MHSRLIEILDKKKKEVAQLKKTLPAPEIEGIPPIRDFKAAISPLEKIALIAEIKFASPSAGSIREKTDPIRIGRIYEQAGASAVSLLTDEEFFHGNLAHLPALKKAITLPILRKDFVIDEIQIKEAQLYGADAVLLIARILSDAQLKEFISMTRDLGMSPLTEIHDQDELDKALACGADIIGINNRDLKTFEVYTHTTLELAPFVPDECIVISESGIEDEGDIRLLKQVRINAVLVGSALMSSDDIGEKTREIVAAGKR